MTDQEKPLYAKGENVSEVKLRVLSLGAGVQSSTLALMAARGEVRTFDACVFADTQGEPADVYRWLEYLTPLLPFPVYRVTAGNLLEASTAIHKSKKSGKLYMKGNIPAFVVSETGKWGLLGRHCTRDFKITPITQKVRELVGGRKAIKNGARVEMAVGISYDEWHRMKPNKEPWIDNVWPLVDMKITRQGCLDWMKKNGFQEPPRSACVFCPFHSDFEWLRLKRSGEFDVAVEAERRLNEALNQQEAIRAKAIFLHASRVPLNQTRLKKEPGYVQLSLFGNECEGMCGV